METLDLVTGKGQVVSNKLKLLMQIACQCGDVNAARKAKGHEMNKQTIPLAVAGAIICAVVVGSAPPSLAAPISSSITAFKQATLSDVTDVRYYRRGYYGRRYYNPGAAIGLGILGAAAGAAAIGSGYYGPGYYGPGYGPGYGYYGNPYPYRRGYYAPY